MLRELAQRQNAFLADAAEAAASGACAALRHVQVQHGDSRAAKLKEVLLQDAQLSHVIHYERDDSLYERYSCCHPDYGRGQEVLYDFASIEAELAHTLVADKALLQMDNLREFPYRLELFRHSSATLLADVSKRIPQEPLSAERVRALQASRGDLAAALGALAVALSMLHKTGGDGEQKLVEYAKQWLPAHAIRRLDEPLLGALPLRHVVAVYEALEERMADVIMTSSDAIDAGRYRLPMPPDVRRELLGCTDIFGAALGASTLARALKRFAVRFLTAEHCRPDVQASMYLTDESLMKWPEDGVNTPGVDLDDVFPQSLLVGHVWEAYEVLTEHIELHKEGRTLNLDGICTASKSETPASGSDGQGEAKQSRWAAILGRLYG